MYFFRQTEMQKTQLRMRFIVFIILTADAKHISMQNNHKKGFSYLIIIFFHDYYFLSRYHLTRAFVEII